MSVRSRGKNLGDIELVAMEDETADKIELERGFQLVARLLLERWEARHAREKSNAGESN